MASKKLPSYPTAVGKKKKKSKSSKSKADDDVAESVADAVSDAVFSYKNLDRYTVSVTFLGATFDELRRRTLPPNVPVYQFLIVLKYIEPKIWRRVQVPSDWTFYQLHLMIKQVMNWGSYHLHVFKMKDKTTKRKINIGQPEPAGFYNAAEAFFGPSFDTMVEEKMVRIDQYFKERNDQGLYKYDFGDRWEHKIWLEEVLTPAENVCYPICLAGKRSRPPEDAGGPFAYADLLEILKNRRHPEYRDKIEWLEMIGMRNFDPEQFNPKDIALGIET